MTSSERPLPSRVSLARSTSASAAALASISLLFACEPAPKAHQDRDGLPTHDRAADAASGARPRKEIREAEATRDAREFLAAPTAADKAKEAQEAEEANAVGRSADGSIAGDSTSGNAEVLRPVLDIDVRSYHLTGSFDWQAQTLTARVDVDMDFAASPEGGRVVLDAVVEGVDSVELDGAGRLDFTYDKSEGALSIDLPASLGAAASGRAMMRIRYRAKESVSLRAVEARAGDPSNVPVVYTTSEPLGAARWMPCHNTPSDRAAFGVTLTSATGERVIANGTLQGESIDQKGTRTTSWRTDYTIPTYLMAFAVGAFQVSEERLGGVPVSVWARQGVRVDTAGLLSMLRAQISTFERLLVPYPFEKYAVVLLPDFPAGGIEHAGISFQRESRSTEASLIGDFGLYAHELAHQWFGDYVTVANWDELWIKEGMATLLAAEASRGFDDRSKSFHLMGQWFGFADGDAIRDTSLSPQQKYTSGPYERSAWFFTQIRSLVGEDAFWAGMRDLLRENAFGTLDAEKVVTRFGKDLGQGWMQAARRALAAKKAPSLSFEGGEMTLLDPEGAVLAPLDVQALDGSATVASTTALDAGERYTLPANGATAWLRIDPRQVHPALNVLLGDKGIGEIEGLRAALFPKTPEQKALVAKLPAPAQSFLFRNGLLADLPIMELEALYPNLAGDQAQYAALVSVCSLRDEAKGTATADVLASWDRLLRAFLESQTFRAYDRRGPGLVACASSVRRVNDDLARKLLARPDRADVSDADVLQLSLTYFDTKVAPELWRVLATGGSSLRIRETALSTLAKYLAEPRLSAATTDTDAWLAFVAGAFRSLAAPELAGGVMDLAEGLGRANLDGKVDAYLGALGEAFEARASAGIQRRAVCAAHAAAKGTDAFAAFRTRVEPFAADASVAVLLADASTCEARR